MKPSCPSTTTILRHAPQHVQPLAQNAPPRVKMRKCTPASPGFAGKCSADQGTQPSTSTSPARCWGVPAGRCTIAQPVVPAMGSRRFRMPRAGRRHHVAQARGKNCFAIFQAKTLCPGTSGVDSGARRAEDPRAQGVVRHKWVPPSGSQRDGREQLCPQAPFLGHRQRPSYVAHINAVQRHIGSIGNVQWFAATNSKPADATGMSWIGGIPVCLTIKQRLAALHNNGSVDQIAHAAGAAVALACLTRSPQYSMHGREDGAQAAVECSMPRHRRAHRDVKVSNCVIRRTIRSLPWWPSCERPHCARRRTATR